MRRPFDDRPHGRGWGRGPGHGQRERFFERGAIRFVLLGLLKEGPMHGYEMIRRLEERSGGRYAPSPGVIYPTLQSLEDEGLVTVVSEGGKKVYTITDSGKAAVEQGPRPFGPERWRGGAEKWEGDLRLRVLRNDIADVVSLLRLGEQAVARSPELLPRLRSVLTDARSALSDLLYSETEPAAKAESSNE